MDYPKLKDELEHIVDQMTLGTTIVALSEIAYDKAEHLRSNWQDSLAARVWERAGAKLDKIANQMDV